LISLTVDTKVFARQKLAMQCGGTKALAHILKVQSLTQITRVCQLLTQDTLAPGLQYSTRFLGSDTKYFSRPKLTMQCVCTKALALILNVQMLIPISLYVGYRQKGKYTLGLQYKSCSLDPNTKYFNHPKVCRPCAKIKFIAPLLTFVSLILIPLARASIQVI
jgi:hypothetical protein